MADAKTREQLEAEWWQRWWAEDFSWAGLAEKLIGKNGATIHGGLHGEQSLQEYWRRDPATGAVRDDTAMRAAGELAECDGVAFHIAHLPPKSKASAATWKSDLKHKHWGALEALLAPRLSAIADTKIDESGGFAGPDGRTQLGGCILRGAISHKPGDASPLYCNAMHAATLGDADYSNRQFGPHGANFEGALFAGSVHFSRANFNTGGRFAGANFNGDANFFSAVFSGDANFDSATFSGLADFVSAAFNGYSRFVSATFSGHARFYSTTFSRGASFVSAAFSGEANFLSATFSGGAGFDRATFSGHANFLNATFSGDVGFVLATFSGDASFDGAAFSGYARFDSATFSGDASFVSAAFSGLARFVSATFSGGASFFDAKFKDIAQFQVKAFEKTARFNRCLFDELVWFDGAAFKGDMDFTAAVFDKLASFEKIAWPQDCRHWHSAFDQALFRGTAVLSGAGFRAFAAFDGVTLERGLQLDDPETEEAANRTFRAERKAAMDSSKRDGEDYEREENERRKREDKDKAKPVSKAEIRAHVRDQRDERLRQLERGCRVLKQAMEFSSNKSREQMLYRFELRARRAQRKLRFGEKTFSDLYGAASDYGASMWRPFAALAVLIAVFAAGFWGIAAALDPFVEAELLAGDWQAQFWSALNFSWSNVFKPLSALSSDVSVKDGSMIDLLLTEAGDGYAFGVRALATAQSLFAIVLAFLFALAVRRRFQIN